MKPKELTDEIKIPENVQFTLDGNIFIFKGDKGEIKRELVSPKIKIKYKDDKIIFSSKNPTKREKMIVNTFKSHIQNMVRGVTKGYTYKLKICAGHFPMNVSIEKDQLVIKNFYGEKIPRKAKILKGVQAKIEGDIILIEGSDKELVGQTAANIEKSCKIVNRDKRIFQDGIYVIDKAGKLISQK